MGVKVVLLLAGAFGCLQLSSAQDGTCYALNPRVVSTIVYRSQLYTVSYGCGFFNIFRCRRSQQRQQSYTMYSTEYIAQFGCCSGYTESGTNQCSDIDECASPTTNNCQQRCDNIPGAYLCSCYPGYNINDDGRTCQDIDECFSNITNNCHHNCTNTVGSYNCSCSDGYVLNESGYFCDPICDPVCENGGTCSAPDTCDCTEGYLGDTCAQAVTTTSNIATIDSSSIPVGPGVSEKANQLLNNQTFSESDGETLALPYIVGGSVGGGVILLLLIALILTLSYCISKKKGKTETSSNQRRTEHFENPVYSDSVTTPKETDKNVPMSEKLPVETSDTTPENMYDEVGLFRDDKVTTPNPDNVYDEIETQATAEDIYEEIDTEMKSCPAYGASLSKSYINT